MGLSGRALQVSPELGGEPERKIHSGIILESMSYHKDIR